MNTSVWIIETGNYSDYSVVGIYSTRERALFVAESVGLKEDCIVERKLDPCLEELNQGMLVFSVFMLRDGTVELIRSSKPTQYNLDWQDGQQAFIWDRANAPAFKDKNFSAVLNATVWAKDEQHAIKIVNEIRTLKVATGEWK
jgi:hypothetical protein